MSICADIPLSLWLLANLNIGIVAVSVAVVIGFAALYCKVCTQVQVTSTAVTTMFLPPVAPVSSVATRRKRRTPALEKNEEKSISKLKSSSVPEEDVLTFFVTSVSPLSLSMREIDSIALYCSTPLVEVIERIAALVAIGAPKAPYRGDFSNAIATMVALPPPVPVPTAN